MIQNGTLRIPRRMATATTPRTILAAGGMVGSLGRADGRSQYCP
jgi:hypothetical protein